MNKDTKVLAHLRCASIHIDRAIELTDKEQSTFRVMKIIEAIREDLDSAYDTLQVELKSDKNPNVRVME